MPDKRDLLVSIITPAYKAEKYIEETVRSVQRQTYPNWEMIIVDDCSPDKTHAVATEISQTDNRVRSLKQERNSGPAASRNVALQHANGRWIAFLDSDDLWLPQKLERQIAFHRSVNAKITFTEYRRISSNGESIGKVIRIPDRLDYRSLLGNTAIATSTVIVDRDKTGTFLMKDIYYDDFGCWLDLLRTGGFAFGFHEDLMRYRVLDHSVSRKKGHSALQVWNTYREVENLGIPASLFYFLSYALRGVLKYRKF